MSKSHRGHSLILRVILLLFFLPIMSLLPSGNVFAFQSTGTITPTVLRVPTVDEVVVAVNAFRESNGCYALNVHQALMQAAQIEADGIASGMQGHWRPNGLTLGQWLITLGYPLSGDLSQDGYRSENWIVANDPIEAIQAWQGDAEHTNTMLSSFRSDIGVGIAVGSDGVVIVLITALRTKTGKMQPTANDFLTLVASTDISIAQGTIVSQYVAPVTLSTARPDGDVFHKVLYGQSLWSIAMAYNTTIDQIRALNNLGQDTTIYEGQLLLVKKSATQPGSVSPTVQETPTPSATSTMQPPTQSVTAAILPSPTITMEKPSSQGFNRSTVAGLFLAILVVGGLMVVISAKKKG
jgi:LysM repeat protein/uncharacterized protein YkwD